MEEDQAGRASFANACCQLLLWPSVSCFDTLTAYELHTHHDLTAATTTSSTAAFSERAPLLRLEAHFIIPHGGDVPSVSWRLLAFHHGVIWHGSGRHQLYTLSIFGRLV